jgi:hypothetical protein
MARNIENDPLMQIGLRVRVSLRNRLEGEAEQRGISVNGEMVRRLEESFDAASIVGTLREERRELHEERRKLLEERRELLALIEKIRLQLETITAAYIKQLEADRDAR